MNTLTIKPPYHIHNDLTEYYGFNEALFSVKRVMERLGINREEAKFMINYFTTNKTIFFENGFVYVHNSFGIQTKNGMYVSKNVRTLDEI